MYLLQTDDDHKYLIIVGKQLLFLFADDSFLIRKKIPFIPFFQLFLSFFSVPWDVLGQDSMSESWPVPLSQDN